MNIELRTDANLVPWCPVVVTFNSFRHQIFSPNNGGPTSKTYYKTLNFLITEIRRV